MSEEQSASELTQQINKRMGKILWQTALIGGAAGLVASCLISLLTIYLLHVYLRSRLHKQNKMEKSSVDDCEQCAEVRQCRCATIDGHLSLPCQSVGSDAPQLERRETLFDERPGQLGDRRSGASDSSENVDLYLSMKGIHNSDPKQRPTTEGIECKEPVKSPVIPRTNAKVSLPELPPRDSQRHIPQNRRFSENHLALRSNQLQLTRLPRRELIENRNHAEISLYEKPTANPDKNTAYYSLPLSTEEREIDKPDAVITEEETYLQPVSLMDPEHRSSSRYGYENRGYTQQAVSPRPAARRNIPRPSTGQSQTVQSPCYEELTLTIRPANDEPIAEAEEA